MRTRFRHRTGKNASKPPPWNVTLATRMAPILSLFTDAKDISSLSDLLGNAVLPLGFPCYAVTRISLTCIRSRPSMSMEAICSHYPNNWVQHYLQHNYGPVDPVHRAAFTSSGPYRWGDITDLNHAERHVLVEACDAGLKNGLSIPIREIGGSVLLINLSGPSSRINPETSRQLASVISNLFRLELDRLAPPHPKEFIQLSPRQRQCLSWVAQGKTSSDICMILKISRHTVEYHITEAMRVLNVNSRIAAAVIASNYGLLD
ncbi:autoinducer binding domain-containing protein [Burkholderia cepacia]|uniref:autoinducer binding domain-containing protein n=1 Tax=Burkholderia cepacia TaxID=292 RepID=UPI00186887E5|nr:autoinducer binding domain-containing protein [Burkholderia cepacia]MBE2966550.1 autoinducer binding domain-containing protein [Burkholderia cepacia]